MRVLIVPEYESYGGALTFLGRLIEINKKQGIQTAVVIQQKQKIPEAMEIFQSSGIKLYISANRKPLFHNSQISFFYDIYFPLKAYLSFKPDIIVVSNCTVGIFKGLLFYPAPVLFFVHSYIVGGMGCINNLSFRCASRLRNIFATVSQASADAMNRYLGIARESIDVVYNSFKPVIPAASTHEPVILTVGHLVWYKNPELWLNVAARVIAQRPNAAFKWVGDGELLEKMRALVGSLGLGHAVRIEGYSKNVERYYQEAAVYFQPSLFESHGIAVVEAMAHAKPCVTSHVGGLPESVIDGETGFTCRHDDVDSFADRIIRLIDDSALRIKMGKAGKSRAETLFSEESQETKVIGLYRQLLR
jgi:glycosyltransferase involved in cell wall biosynthesis